MSNPYKDVLKVMKMMSQEVESSQVGSDVFFGEVTKSKPLEILVEQKLLIKEDNLAVAEHLTDYETKIKLEWQWSEGEDITSHPVVKKDTWMKVYNALKVGDQVILIRRKGGQLYVVIDRLKGGRA